MPPHSASVHQIFPIPSALPYKTSERHCVFYHVMYHRIPLQRLLQQISQTTYRVCENLNNGGLWTLQPLEKLSYPSQTFTNKNGHHDRIVTANTTKHQNRINQPPSYHPNLTFIWKPHEIWPGVRRTTTWKQQKPRIAKNLRLHIQTKTRICNTDRKKKNPHSSANARNPEDTYTLPQTLVTTWNPKLKPSDTIRFVP